MGPRKSNDRNLKPGDLVTHALYGKEWIGIIVSIKSPEKQDSKEIISKKKAVVQIQPGTAHEGFFERTSAADRVNKNLGYVSIHWLFKWEVDNVYTGFTRNKTPEC